MTTDEIETRLTNDPLITSGELLPLELTARSILLAANSVIASGGGYGDDRPLALYSADSVSVTAEFRRTNDVLRQGFMWRKSARRRVGALGMSVAISKSNLFISISSGQDLRTSAHITPDTARLVNAHIPWWLSGNIEPLTGPTIEHFHTALLEKVDQFELIIPPYSPQYGRSD